MNSSFKNHFHNPNSLYQGLITGLYDGGCLLGSIFAFCFGEKLGRKRSIYIAAMIVIIWSIIQCTAPNVMAMIVARVITGVGVGIATSVIPAYQAEVSPPCK